MKLRQIDQLLSDREEAPAPPLTSGFAPAVLKQARQLKAALLRHRRWLMISSLIAVTLAVAISARVGQTVETVPPPLDAFRTPGFTVPTQAP